MNRGACEFAARTQSTPGGVQSETHLFGSPVSCTTNRPAAKSMLRVIAGGLFRNIL
jgi:hypothetical protein